jgi:hypothetical protein
MSIPSADTQVLHPFFDEASRPDSTTSSTRCTRALPLRGAFDLYLLLRVQACPSARWCDEGRPADPSLKKRVAARTSPARWARHSLGLKTPRSWGWLTNPRKAAYNRVYHRTTFGLRGCVWILLLPGALLAWWLR